MSATLDPVLQDTGKVCAAELTTPHGSTIKKTAPAYLKPGLKALALNRRKAIRERCLNCSCWIPKEVQHCFFQDCPLYEYRSGIGRQNAKARDKAIKTYCLWCMVGQRAEIAKCVSVHCALFQFRKDRRDKSNPLPKKAHGEVRIEANSPL